MPQSGSRPIQISAGFNDDLIRDLALLHEASPETAAATVALMGFGSRALLLASDPPSIEVSAEQPFEITVTPHGWKLIAACAKSLEEALGPDWESLSLDADSDGESYEDKLERTLEVIRSDSEEGDGSRGFIKRVLALLP